MEKEKVYLDSTIPSYAVGKVNRDLVVAARQEITVEWWEKERMHFELYGSFVLLEEIEDGLQELAEQRLNLVKEITILDYKPEIEEMARQYVDHFKFPEKLFRDMYHVAFAVYYKMDYLLTWNFTHLANIEIEKQLIKLNQKMGFEMPGISTPEEVRKLKIRG